jgi:hypothetical protein
MRIGSQLKPK